jgi:hypothetical protein
MQCNAKSRNGQQCKNQAINGTTKCHMHGGASLAGIAHPNFKHGRYSKHLPSRLAARYSEALSDPALLELREEVALTQTRQTELLEQLDSGLSLARWRSAQTAYGDLLAAMQEKDSTGLQRALIALEDALGVRVTDDSAVWEEVVTLSEHRRRLVESEHKRLVAMQQMITTEQAMALLARITESIRKHVSDPSILAAIATELRAIVNAGAGEQS